MNKKAISPLIATVLLIGFTIVLAAVVMQWGGSFVRQLTQQQAVTTTTATECMQVGFEINDAKFNTPNVITFKVTNSKDKPLGGFVALVDQGDAGSVSLVTTDQKYVDCPVEAFSTSAVCAVSVPDGVAIDLEKLTTTWVDKLKLIPMVDVEGEPKGCTLDSAVSKELKAGIVT